MRLGADPWLALCALHSAGFGVFHLAFWKLFDWPRSLATAGRVNSAIIQIANLRLAYVFFGIAALCLAYPEALRGTPLGRALLAGMALFWLCRIVEQWLFLRIHHFAVHALTALFALGAVLFAMPLR